MTILIVDDSKAMRMIVKRALRQADFGDHEFKEATNGREALEMIRTSKPNLVLCDWNMPEMTGIELLRKINEEGIQVRFGFITSESTKQMKETATEAGALFLLSKPFTAEALRHTLSPVFS